MTIKEDIDQFGVPVFEDEDSKVSRAKNADIITMPDDIEGTNCGNCSFFEEGHCHNKSVDQPVTARMCCNFWDHPGTTRPLQD